MDTYARNRHTYKRFSSRALMLMEASYSRNAYPGPNVINVLAEILDEQPDRIKRWFATRRLKHNKPLRMRDREFDRSCFPSSYSYSHPSDFLRGYTYPFLSSACNTGLFRYPQTFASAKPNDTVNWQFKSESTVVNGTGSIINRKVSTRVTTAAPFLSSSSNFNMLVREPTQFISPLAESSMDRCNDSTANKPKKSVRRSLVLPPKPSSGVDSSKSFLSCEIRRDQVVPFVSDKDDLLEDVDFEPPRYSTPMIYGESSLSKEPSSQIQVPSLTDNPTGSEYPKYEEISPASTPRSVDISCNISNSSVSRSQCPNEGSNLLSFRDDSSFFSSAICDILSLDSSDAAQCDLADSISRDCSTLHDCVASSDQNTSEELVEPAAQIPFPLEVMSESGWYSDIDDFIQDFNKNKDTMDR